MQWLCKNEGPWPPSFTSNSSWFCTTVGISSDVVTYWPDVFGLTRQVPGASVQLGLTIERWLPSSDHVLYTLSLFFLEKALFSHCLVKCFSPLHGNGLVLLQWMGPTESVRQFYAGEIQLAPPQLSEIATLQM